MRRRRQLLQVQTFPFLAVLLCTMGALILLLLVIDRRAKAVARAKALQAVHQAAEADAKSAADRQAEWESKRRELRALLARQEEDLMVQIRAVQQQAAAAAGKLEAAMAHSADLQQQLQAEEALLLRDRQDLQARRADVHQAEEMTAATRQEALRQAAELAQLEQVLSSLKALRKNEQKTYSIVPYLGRNGDNRRPLYVECCRGGVIFHPDRLALGGADLAALTVRKELDRRLEEQRQSASAKTAPYLLLLVRPDGLRSFYLMQSALAGLRIDFGYELIDQDWVLDLGDGAQMAGGLPRSSLKVPRPIVPAPPMVGTGWHVRHGTGPGGSAAFAFPLPPGIGPNPGDGSGPASTFGGRTASSPGVSGPSWARSSGSGFASSDGGIGSERSGSLFPPSSSLLHQGAGLLGPGTGSGYTGPGAGGPGLFAASAAGAESGAASVLPPLVLRPRAGSSNAGSGPAAASSNPVAGLGPPSFPAGNGPSLAGAQPGTKGGAEEAGEAPHIGVPLNLRPGGPSAADMGQGGPGSAGIAGVPRPSGESGVPGRPDLLPSVPFGSQGQTAAGSPGASGPRRATGSPGSTAGSADEAGEPGDEALGSPLQAGPVLPRSRAAAGSAVPLGRRIANHDWTITVECGASQVVLLSTGQRFPVATLRQTPGVPHPLPESIRRLIERRQATVRPGESPYRPVLRFRVYPDGLRSYYAANALLDGLRLPASRENVDGPERTLPDPFRP